MNKAHIFIIGLSVCVVFSSASSANNYNHDGQSCNIKSNENLQDLCPNDFGMPTYGPMANQIAAQPNNANMIVDAANAQGVPANLALAVSGAEGGLSSCAGSFSGVKGPMQVTQSTAKGFGYNRDINSQNIQAGVATLKGAINRCGGTSDISCLASVYNGSTAAQQAGWTRNVTNNLAQLNNNPSLAPAGCSQSGTKNPTDCPAGGGTTPTDATPPSGTPTLNLPASAG